MRVDIGGLTAHPSGESAAEGAGRVHGLEEAGWELAEAFGEDGENEPPGTATASGRRSDEGDEPLALMSCVPETLSWWGRLESPWRGKFLPGRGERVPDGRVAEIEHVGEAASDVHDREGVLARRDPVARSSDNSDFRAQGLEV